MPSLGAPELIIILVVVVIIFGVGRLPEVGGALGKGIKEFRKSAKGEGEDEKSLHPSPFPLHPTYLSLSRLRARRQRRSSVEPSVMRYMRTSR